MSLLLPGGPSCVAIADTKHITPPLFLDGREPSGLYILAEDLCSGLIGPFADMAAVNVHFGVMRQRGDGGVIKGIYDETHPEFAAVKAEAGTVLTPQDDIDLSYWESQVSGAE